MNVLFIDNNLGLDHALRLGKECYVFYFNEWRNNYIKADEWVVGMGFEKISPGMMKILDPLQISDIDLVFMADSAFGIMGDYYREHGIDVFGPSIGSDRLELWREWAAAKMNEYGIKTPKYERVVGYENLVESVKGRDVFVKVSAFRGSFETAHVTDVSMLHAAMENSGLGPLRDSLVFLVSEKIDGVEVGVDLWWNGREFLRPYHLGNEVKGYATCFGKWVSESRWDEVLGRFENLLRNEAPTFRGEISLEAIYNESGFFVLDITPRLARPAGSLMYYSLSGRYIDVVKAVARGELVEYSLKGIWTAQVGLSSCVERNWCYVCDVEDVVDDMFFTAKASVIDGKVWITPRTDGNDVVFFVGRVGNDFKDVVKGVYSRASEIAMGGDLGLVGGAWQKYRDLYLPMMERYGFDWGKNL